MRRRLRARARAIEGSPAQICARAARRSQSSVPDGGRGRRHSEMRRHSRALHGCGKRPSRLTRPRARFGGGSITWRRPCAAGPLPQGTQTVRREPRRRQGETHSSPRALFERDARPWRSPPCTLPRSRSGGGGITWRRPYAAGPLPQGTQTERWEPRRRQGETCSPSRALLECDARP